jgi:hypothetical protein
MKSIINKYSRHKLSFLEEVGIIVKKDKFSLLRNWGRKLAGDLWGAGTGVLVAPGPLSFALLKRISGDKETQKR